MTTGKRLATATLAAICLAAAGAAVAQNTADPNAVDAIIGTEVQEEEIQAAAEPDRVIAAIEKTAQNTATVRKTSSLDKVDIVFLSDSTRSEGGPPAAVEAKVKEREAEIAELRKEIEGNAMLFHAVDSRQILPQDILAVEFDDANGIVIFAAAKPAS
ncbi:hypothetical protein [Mesorhizobium sp. KR9-304]|uniref:hypothetical protein n=1 Tax=Mesorhizobium sp. KR9-304 TaxID=3156614 RepID=UPI0032B40573